MGDGGGYKSVSQRTTLLVHERCFFKILKLLFILKYKEIGKMIPQGDVELWNCKPLGDGLHFSNTEVQFHVHLSSSRPYFSGF